MLGLGTVPVDGVRQISYSHCLNHALPFSFITYLFFHQSIFFHLILYLLFPSLFWSFSSSITVHFKFQSLHYHIFIFFPQNMIVPLHTTCFSHPIYGLLKSLLKSSLFLLFSKLPSLFLSKHHASLSYNIADLTQLLYNFPFIFNENLPPLNFLLHFLNFIQPILVQAVTAVSHPPVAFNLSPR